MAARLNPRHADQTRAKIQANRLIEELQKCALGEREMTKTQISAAVALLDRAVPKLQQIQMTGEGGDSLFKGVTVNLVKAKHRDD